MAAEKLKYKRLPGRKRGILHGASLWLGEDHLLAVNGWRFGEEYKRYYYRDIQAIVITKARRFMVPVPWLVSAVPIGLLALLFGVAEYAGHDVRQSTHIGFEIFLFGLVTLLLYLLLASLFRSCRCRIQTAVSLDDLPSLYRLRTALKAVKILEARIAQTQGMLQPGWTGQVSIPEIAPVGFKPPQMFPGGMPAKMTAATAEAHAAALKTFSRLEIAFYSLLALGGVTLLIPPLWFSWSVILAAEAILGIVVFIQQLRRGGPKVLRWMPIGSVIYVGIVKYCGWMIGLFGMIGSLQAHPLDFKEIISQHFDLRNQLVLRVFLVSGNLAFAVARAILAWRKRVQE